MAAVESAQEAWRLLHGVFCVYKPADMSFTFLRKILLANLCRDFSHLRCSPQMPLISIEGSMTGKLEVVKKENFACHPLVLGQLFQPEDFKISCANHMDKDTSGVCVIGINRGGGPGVKCIREARLIRTYHLKGKLGRATDTHYITGKVVERSTFRHVTKGHINRVLMTIQAAHQRKMVDFLGLDIQSQESYEALSADGLVRPEASSPPLLYVLKLVNYEFPEFTIEVSSINEKGDYLKLLIHEIGLMLKTNAVCAGLRCIRNGPFVLNHALLRKHWTISHIISHIGICNKLMENIVPHTPSLGEFKSTCS